MPVWTHCSGELMSSSGPLLILEGSMDPHWAWGFCSKWFFRDFSPSENKDMIFRMLPFHQDVSGGFSWRRCWVWTHTLMTPQFDMFVGEKCITPIRCSSSLGDRLRNRGIEFHKLKWVTTDSCVCDRQVRNTRFDIHFSYLCHQWSCVCLGYCWHLGSGFV